MSFFQDPPRLGNQYDDDALLSEYLARALPADALAAHRRRATASWASSAAASCYRHAAGPIATTSRCSPSGTPWGNRDRSHRGLAAVAARPGAGGGARPGRPAAYERPAAAISSRVHQFALNYLVQASLDVYSCPLAMTDGAARTLLDTGNAELIDRAVPRLTSRDPARMWTSGQWMTERTGGSDVGLSETVARKDADGTWRLYGTKWFTSATTAEMALTLARPEGNGPGGRGLALFYVELRDARRPPATASRSTGSRTSSARARCRPPS